MSQFNKVIAYDLCLFTVLLIRIAPYELYTGILDGNSCCKIYHITFAGEYLSGCGICNILRNCYVLKSVGKSEFFIVFESADTRDVISLGVEQH